MHAGIITPFLVIYPKLGSAHGMRNVYDFLYGL